MILFLQNTFICVNQTQMLFLDIYIKNIIISLMCTKNNLILFFVVFILIKKGWFVLQKMANASILKVKI